MKVIIELTETKEGNVAYLFTQEGFHQASPKERAFALMWREGLTEIAPVVAKALNAQNITLNQKPERS